MFNVGTGELLVILLVALLVLGPEKLPDSARKIGNVVGELRRMSQGFHTEVRKAMDEVKPDTTTTGPPSTPLTKLEPVADDVEPDEQRAASSDDPAA
jgi:sec-independent protein translocase protein TatB